MSGRIYLSREHTQADKSIAMTRLLLQNGMCIFKEDSKLFTFVKISISLLLYI